MRDLEANELLTEPLQIAFPHLFEKRAIEAGQRETYQATVLLGADVDLAPFKRAMKAAIKDKFGKVHKKNGKLYVKVGKKTKELRLPLKDASEKAEQYEGYEEDGYYINVNTGTPPGLVDHKNRTVTDPTTIYAGCWCRFYLSAYGWEHSTGGYGVSFSLNAVQKVKDDEPFAGGFDATSVFEPLDLDDDDDDIDEGDEDDDDDFGDLM